MNLQGFSTEQQQYGGLHRLADNLRQDKRYEEQRNHQRAQMEQQRKLSTGKFLADLGDPKDLLTGSPLDPEFVRRLGTIVQEGQGMAAEGADYATLQMSLAPKVNELLQYSAKAKAITEQGKRYGELLKGEKYINLPEFEKTFRQTAFYNADGSLKDVSEIDPGQDYGDMVLRQHPDKIATSAGFDEFYENQVKNNSVTELSDITRYNSLGGMSRDKVKIKRAGYFVPEVDAKGATVGFVPKYKIATNENQPLLNTFFDPEGKEVDAPIRLLDDEFYDQLGPKQLIYLNGQAKLLAQQVEQATGQKVDLNGPQGRMLKQAIAYEEFAAPTRKGWSIENADVENKPSNVQVKIAAGIPLTRSEGGSKSGEPTIRDIFSEVNQKSTEQAGRGQFLRLNALSATAQRIILEYANKLQGGNLTQADIKIWKDPGGNINIVGVEDNKIIAPIDFGDVNIPAQVDVKGKRAAAEGGGSPQSTSTPKKKISW